MHLLSSKAKRLGIYHFMHTCHLWVTDPDIEYIYICDALMSG